MPFLPLFGSGGTTHNVTVTDNVGVTDALTKQLNKQFTDSAGITDTFAKRWTKDFADTLALTDSVVVSKTKLFSASDTIDITDILNRTVTKGRTESAGISDSVALSQGQANAEDMGLTDSFSISLVKLVPGLENAINITTSFAKRITKGFTDLVGITDSTVIETDGEPEPEGPPMSIMDADGGYSGLRSIILTELTLTPEQASLLDMDTLVKLYWQSVNGQSATVPIPNLSTMDIIRQGAVSGPAGIHDPYEVA